MLVSAGYVGQSLLLHRQGVRSNRILIARVTLGEKNFCLSGGLPVLLAKAMKGKSSMTCITISNGTLCN